MNRRQVLKSMTLAGVAAFVPGVDLLPTTGKKHFMTISFDDGFKKSSLKTVEIFEKHGLKACINIIAGRNSSANFLPPDEWHRYPVGDWQLWNELHLRGHEIMPHGLVHAQLSQLPLTVAKNMINVSLDIFSDKLKGFDPLKSVFNFPYNSSSPELEDWIKTKVLAFRTGGSGLNDVPFKEQKKLSCIAGSEMNNDKHLYNEVDKLLKLPQGWLIYNAHGIDDEGWGPISAKALDRLLGRLKTIDSVEVAPATELLNRINL